MSIGERMKTYESLAHNDRFMPLSPVIVRLDGVGFSGFTKNLQKPFDNKFCDCMDAVTSFLVKETNAVCGYTQSDEISLLLFSNKHKSQIYFDAKIAKIISVLASKTSVYFNNEIMEHLPSKKSANPVFDCRAFNLPNFEEVFNYFYWRQSDAKTNSISMAAQHYYSHNQLHGVSSADKLKMLEDKHPWDLYPSRIRYGVFFMRKVVTSKLLQEEIDGLPEKHHARLNPDIEFTRSVITSVDLDLSVVNFDFLSLVGE